PVQYLVQSPEAAPVASFLSTMGSLSLTPATPAAQASVYQLDQAAGHTPVSAAYLLSSPTSASLSFSPAATITFSYAPFSVADPASLVIDQFDNGALSHSYAPSSIETVNKTVTYNNVLNASHFLLAKKPTDVLPPRTVLAVGAPSAPGAPFGSSFVTG